MTHPTDLAARHSHILKFAASKEWARWSNSASSNLPFGPEEIDQWALEAILIMGGVMRSGRRLQSLEECGDKPGWVQRNVDLYVRDKTSKAYRASQVIGRRSDVYLDEPLDPETPGTTWADEILAPVGETNPDGISGLRERFPLLFARYVDGEYRSDMLRRLHIAPVTLYARMNSELAELAQWAIDNRRVKGELTWSSLLSFA